MASWWSNERIDAVVTKEYIFKKVETYRQCDLLERVPFGRRLTNDTYLDWIFSRSKRLFLILEDIGVPEHIFKAVDKSFDDDDLPLTPAAIRELELPGNSAFLDRKFYERQRAYIVQDLDEGAHVNYVEGDVVPVEPLTRTKGLPNQKYANPNVDRVQVRDKTFWRRRMALDEASGIERIHFVLHFKSLQRVKHPHLTSVWATYTRDDVGYILFYPSSELTLKHFLDDPPKHFKSLPKPEQREIIVHWVQCLTNALACLHENGYAHQAIRASNIFIDSQYNIFFGAYAAMGALDDMEPAYDRDTYNHAAPEQWRKRATLAQTAPLKTTLQGGGRTRRRLKQNSVSSGTSSRRLASPMFNHSPIELIHRPPAGADIDSINGSARGSRPLSRNAPTLSPSSSGSSGVESFRARGGHALVSALTFSQPDPASNVLDESAYYPSDVFSLSTILTALLTMLASISTSGSKLSPSNIPTHLGKKNRTPGRGGAPADTSYHANLGQVSTWLDSLEECMEKPASTSLKLSFGRKSADRKEDTSESWRWRGAMGSLIALVRQGLYRDPNSRWTSMEGSAYVNTAFKKWGISSGTCCRPTETGLDEGMMSAAPSVLEMPRSESVRLSFNSQPYANQSYQYELADSEFEMHNSWNVDTPVEERPDHDRFTAHHGFGAESESTLHVGKVSDWPAPLALKQHLPVRSRPKAFVREASEQGGSWGISEKARKGMSYGRAL